MSLAAADCSLSRANCKNLGVESLNRTFLTKLHLWLAAFMFPAIVMFLGTGALYTWGVTGETVDSETAVSIAAPLDADDEAGMRAIAERHLAAEGLALPTGKARVRRMVQGFVYEWTGSRRDILIEPTPDPTIAKVVVKEATPHRVLVQLHKAKASTLFKVYASVLATALFLLVATGLILGLQVKTLRRTTMVGSLAGLAFFIAIVAAS